MADVSKLQIGSETYNISDIRAKQTATAAQQTASQASQTATSAQNAANTAKTLALKGFSVAFSEPDTITFTKITEG